MLENIIPVKVMKQYIRIRRRCAGTEREAMNLNKRKRAMNFATCHENNAGLRTMKGHISGLPVVVSYWRRLQVCWWTMSGSVLFHKTFWAACQYDLIANNNRKGEGPHTNYSKFFSTVEKISYLFLFFFTFKHLLAMAVVVPELMLYNLVESEINLSTFRKIPRPLRFLLAPPPV